MVHAFVWEMTLHRCHTLRLRCDTFTGLQSKSSKISIDCIVAGTLCHNLSIALNMSDNEDQKPTDSAAGDQKGEPITIRVRDQVSLCTATLTLNKKNAFAASFLCIKLSITCMLTSYRSSISSGRLMLLSYSYHMSSFIDWGRNILQNQKVNKNVKGDANICKQEGCWCHHTSLFSINLSLI